MKGHPFHGETNSGELWGRTAVARQQPLLGQLKGTRENGKSMAGTEKHVKGAVALSNASSRPLLGSLIAAQHMK